MLFTRKSTKEENLAKAEAGLIASVALVAVLAEYKAAKADEAAAARRARSARATLSDVKAGVYGPFVVAWKKGRQILDQKAARALLGDNTPMMTTEPSLVVEEA